MRMDAEFRQNLGAILSSLGSAAPDALGGERLCLAVGAALFDRVEPGVEVVLNPVHLVFKATKPIHEIAGLRL